MRFVFAILLLGWVASLSGRTLVVSLGPYREAAEALAGPGWEIVVALPQGGDHESYSPTPGHMRRLYGADVYWASGMGFERLVLPKLQRANASMRVVRAQEDRLAVDHPDDAGHPAQGDLHRWLNPALMMQDAAALTEVLVEIDPDHAQDYRLRQSKFNELCLHLAVKIEAQLAPFRGEAIFVYHAAFEHFVESFGLTQIALEQAGREPSLRELTEIVEQARAAHASVVYVLPQHRRGSAEAFARALNARLEEVDPMAEDWSENLLRMARRFADDLAARKEAAR